MNNPKPHPHAELIKLWADDTSLEFEWRMSDDGFWNTCLKSKPLFNEDLQYRLKPKEPQFITINGVKVPKPEINPLPRYQTYYIPIFDVDKDYQPYAWYNDSVDKHYLKNGMVHLNPEAATIHKKAIVKVNTGN